MRIHNFSAGPGALPESVLREAQVDLFCHGESGIGITECSHRSPQFDEVIEGVMNLDGDEVSDSITSSLNDIEGPIHGMLQSPA